MVSINADEAISKRSISPDFVPMASWTVVVSQLGITDGRKITYVTITR
jgi:hypothetical protein